MSLRPSSIGHGAVTYMYSSSLCPVCKALDRKFPGVIPGINVRYIATALAPQETGAVLQVWRNPAFPNYKRYMAGQYARAGALSRNGSQADIVEYNCIINIIDEINMIFTEHSGTRDPMFTAGTPRQIVPMMGDAVLMIRGEGFELIRSLNKPQLEPYRPMQS